MIDCRSCLPSILLVLSMILRFTNPKPASVKSVISELRTRYNDLFAKTMQIFFQAEP